MKKTISAGILALASVVLLAQEEQKNDTIPKEHIHLSDIIVKGDFSTDPTFTVQVNNQSEQPVQPKNVADLFQNVEGMNFIKRGNYAIDPSFRASQYEQLNVQYDGGVKAMHACPNRMDPVTTHILPEEVDKIEVIKGPYSVRYGANFGGVINMVTTKPGMKEKGLSGDVKAGFESNGTTYLTSGGLQYVGNKFHLKGNVGYRDFGNYDDGNGDEVPSAFKSTDYALGAGYSPNHKHHIMVHWRESFGRDVLHAGLPMDTDIDDSSIFSFDYYANHLSGVLNQFTVKAYYSSVNHIMSNTLRPSFNMMEAISSVYADTYGGKIEAKWIPNKKLNIFTGVDMFNVKREGAKRVLRKVMNGNPVPNPMWRETDVWQDAYINDLGVFTEGSYRISESIALKAGLRLDFVNSKPESLADNFQHIYGNLNEFNDTNISGHIGLKYASESNHIWELALGRGVRSANMTERYINYFTVGQDAYRYVGNPNLKPEANHQIELGFKNKTRLSDESSFQFNYGFSAYYAMLTDYITAVVNNDLVTPMAPMVKSFVNIEDAYKTGFELFIDTHFTQNWTLGTSLAYVYAKNKYLDESLSLTPPLTAKFNLKYGNNKFMSNLKFRAVATQKEIATSFGETETPGYGVMDLEMVYKPLKGLSVGGAVLNIFDKSYHNHQNFVFKNQADFGMVPINEMGRNFTLFTRYSF